MPYNTDWEVFVPTILDNPDARNLPGPGTGTAAAAANGTGRGPAMHSQASGSQGPWSVRISIARARHATGPPGGILWHLPAPDADEFLKLTVRRREAPNAGRRADESGAVRTAPAGSRTGGLERLCGSDRHGPFENLPLGVTWCQNASGHDDRGESVGPAFPIQDGSPIRMNGAQN